MGIFRGDLAVSGETIVQGGSSTGGTQTLGTTDSFPLDIMTAGIVRASFTETGELGVNLGGDTPFSKLEVKGTGAVDGFVSAKDDSITGVQGRAWSNVGFFSPRFVSMKARGTEATPAAVQSNDALFRLMAKGHDGTDFYTADGARLEVRMVGTPSPSSQGTRFDFITNPDGSAGIGGAGTAMLSVENAQTLVRSDTFQFNGALNMGFTGGDVNSSTDTATHGRTLIYPVRSDNGAYTLTIADADATNGRMITILDTGNNAATNNITIALESGAQVWGDGTAGSKTINTNAGVLRLVNMNSAWWEI